MYPRLFTYPVLDALKITSCNHHKKSYETEARRGSGKIQLFKVLDITILPSLIPVQ